MVTVAGQGQIAKMTLPEGWERRNYKTKADSFHGAISANDYFVPGADGAKLSFYYRGAPVSPASAKAFSDLIKAPAHQLTEQEYESIWELMGPASNPEIFKTERIETVDLNGRNVLIVEGEFVLHKQKTVGLFIDADGSGRFVQQIYFTASAEDYSKYASLAEQAFDSIEWLNL